MKSFIFLGILACAPAGFAQSSQSKLNAAVEQVRAELGLSVGSEEVIYKGASVSGEACTLILNETDSKPTLTVFTGEAGNGLNVVSLNSYYGSIDKGSREHDIGVKTKQSASSREITVGLKSTLTADRPDLRGGGKEWYTNNTSIRLNVDSSNFAITKVIAKLNTRVTQVWYPVPIPVIDSNEKKIECVNMVRVQ